MSIETSVSVAPLSSSIASPLTVRDAIAVVTNSDLPDSSKANTQSVLVSTARHLARLEGLSLTENELLDYDIRPSISILHAAARDLAKTRGVLRPTEYVSRMARLVELITGRRPTARQFHEPCPRGFEQLLEASPDKHANSKLAYLARLCRYAQHFDAPRSFPSFDTLLAAGRELAELEGAAEGSRVPDDRVRRRVIYAVSCYRVARAQLVAGKSDGEVGNFEADYAVIGSYRNLHHARHLGVEPRVLEYVRSHSLRPEGMTPFEILDAVNHALAEDYRVWITETRGARLAAATRQQTLNALLRVCGAIVRAGHFDKLLKLEGVDDLFAVSITVPGTRKLNSRAARRAGVSPDEVPPEVISLLEGCLDHDAGLSLSQSTVTSPEHLGGMEKPYFTDAIATDADCMWRLVRDLYRVLEATNDTHAARWGLIHSRWVRLLGTIEDRLLPKTARLTAKDKLLAIKTVTLPQLMCIGLPMRRRAILALRDKWQECLAASIRSGFVTPDDHPQVRAAKDEYFSAAVAYTMLCVALDDGVRVKQYTHGRLGINAHFRPQLSFDSNGAPTGLTAMLTRWDGDLSDPAHLKVAEKGGEPQKREDRDLRPGIVDFRILWDLISIWRPQQLVNVGAYASIEDYDLLEDINSGRFALFPASRPVSHPHAPRSNTSPMIGRELHRIVRSYLRPDVPEWHELEQRWRCIWSAHILRLLNGSYWGGVRDDYPAAMWLTMDTEVTLRKQYVVVNDYLRDRVGLDKSNWENPNAFDDIVDALFKGRQVFDPLERPDLPLPAHLKGKVQSKVPALSKPRIRRARNNAAV